MTAGTPQDETPPADVMEWVRETYYQDGVDIWLDAWRSGDAAKREHMERMARFDDMGT